jgi:hypothetical protein
MHLTAEQEHEAERIAAILLETMQEEAKNIGRLLASKANSELFGQTEFQLRDILLRLGTQSVEAVLAERKKRGAKDPA